MANLDDPMYSRIHGLAVGVLEGALSDAQRQELESLLLSGSRQPAARTSNICRKALA